MSIELTGIADEAGASLDVQIAAHQQLRWGSIEARVVEIDGVKSNLHEIPEESFERVVERLNQVGMRVCGFGSLIGNWAKKITDDFSITEAEVGRSIQRMKRLGTKLIRVMSYAVCRNDAGGDAQEQFAPERIRRMREVNQRFADEGLTVVHENCMNWGGMSPTYVHRMAEAVPGMKWVFDTGNPVFIDDRDKPGQKQNSWEMYQAIKPHIAHVHVKDGRWDHARNDAVYTYPGEGDGQVERILADLLANGYEGLISIEPHVAVVFHGAGSADQLDPEQKAREQLQSYLKYGQMLEAMLVRLGAQIRR